MFDALSFLAQVRCPQRDAALAWFYERWQAKDRVIDKWFTVQALSRVDGAVDEVLALESHPAMSMSNRPRSMAFYGSFFRQNRVAFHDPSGKGYEMLADRLLYIDKANPGATYWLMPQILQWRRYDDARQLRMRAVLERVARSPGISKALQENVGRALAD
jgi:aminopeptidase N